MTAATELVRRSFLRLQAIDINEQPSAAEAAHGLALLNEVIEGFGANGIEAGTQTLVCSFTNDNDIVTVDLGTAGVSPSTAGLMIGLNVTGDGMATGARVKDVRSSRAFQVNLPPTADGGAVSLVFGLLPVPTKYEGAIVALLAVRLSEDMGLPVSPKLQMDAAAGWASMLAGYLPDRKASFDRAMAAPAGVWDRDMGWFA